ncbi:alkaline phosphatase PhoX [Hyphococcus sp.]|uniref:alkaline phosphatase PhoX n=1 Tax=Hyphococcus sp. TaxID=2038636 RepID=UPI003CCBDFF5
MIVSRRNLLQSAYGVAFSYSSLSLLAGAHAYSANNRLPLKTDPDGLLDLPEGFSYRLVSTSGGEMSDGFFRPGRPDGMACFAHPQDAGKCILTRNHENWPDTTDGSPFGEDDALVSRLSEAQLYDYRAAAAPMNGRPFYGGVTTAIYNLQEKRLEKDFLTLAGTAGNCAGGATPWGSWLSCEESAVTAPGSSQKNHGFVFEVPISATRPVDAIPLTDMGRFAHEAAAVDLDTDIVYLTEDSLECLFYRFLPHTRQDLSKGGRLQALALKNQPSADTRNWPRDWGGAGENSIRQGETFDVEWIDLDHVDSPDGDLAERGFAAGAAHFCRGEGMAYGKRDGEQGSVYFNCTQGGAARAGQVWRYTPSPEEGRRGEASDPGKLTLVYESPTSDVLDMCDNLAFAPWGDLILCEDGRGDQYLRGLTPDGNIYDLARNAHEEQSEFCGACFSPDGSVLFVNVQEPGFTFAIEGPWRRLRA